MVAETSGFLELDIFSVKKILQSSNLCITSEIEVFHAANYWVCHNSEQRSKFAKDLLLSVRLPLLSEPALTYLLQDTSSICDVNECNSIMNDILLNSDAVLKKLPSKKFEARYCDLFKILLLENSQNVTELKEVNLKTLNAIKFKTPNDFDLKNFKIQKVVF